MDTDLSSRLYYPNPFQPTGIEFILGENAQVTVKILDVVGKEIETLIDHLLFTPGKHIVPFDQAKYGEGEYWYQITVTTGERKVVETKQLR